MPVVFRTDIERSPTGREFPQTLQLIEGKESVHLI